MVTPCEGVGVETRKGRMEPISSLVTPCEGVGVETGEESRYILHPIVTPCEGVGVETDMAWVQCMFDMSRLARAWE